MAATLKFMFVFQAMIEAIKHAIVMLQISKVRGFEFISHLELYTCMSSWMTANAFNMALQLFFLFFHPTWNNSVRVMQ